MRTDTEKNHIKDITPKDRVIEQNSYRYFQNFILKMRSIVKDSLVRIPLGLWAREEQVAVYDNKTGQMHVQVSCSGYFITGNPPLYMEWTVSIN